MKKCLALPLIALALLTMFIYIGCGAKEIPPSIAEAPPPVQEAPETREPNEAPDADHDHESSEAPAEHEAAAEQESHEAEESDEAADHEAAEETSEHESAKKKHRSMNLKMNTSLRKKTSEHESEDEHESAEETSEHESEDAEHDSAEEASEHEATEEPPQHAEPENMDIPSGSVLHLIPDQVMGLVYCPSLLELDYRINTLVTDLMPTADNPEILAEILADTFGAGFESLTELEEIGLDLNQDFAIFMNALDSSGISATVHLTDPAAMQQVIDAESEGSAPTVYNGETYWNAVGGEGHFAILENILVFSRSAEVCESVIDTYKGTQRAVTSHPNYRAFLTDVLDGETQLGVHFEIEPIAPLLIEGLEEEAESMQDGLESDPAAMAIAPLLTSMFDTAIDMLKAGGIPQCYTRSARRRCPTCTFLEIQRWKRDASRFEKHYP